MLGRQSVLMVSVLALPAVTTPLLAFLVVHNSDVCWFAHRSSGQLHDGNYLNALVSVVVLGVPWVVMGWG